MHFLGKLFCRTHPSNYFSHDVAFFPFCCSVMSAVSIQLNSQPRSILCSYGNQVETSLSSCGHTCTDLDFPIAVQVEEKEQLKNLLKWGKSSFYEMANQLPSFSISRLANVKDILNVNINVSISDYSFKYMCIACYLNLVFIASPILQCQIWINSATFHNTKQPSEILDLQDVLEDGKLLRWRHNEDVVKTCLDLLGFNFPLFLERN